jgi:hypothetical protein
MQKKKLIYLEKQLIWFRNSDYLGLGEMAELETIDGLISWIHELIKAE